MPAASFRHQARKAVFISGLCGLLGGCAPGNFSAGPASIPAAPAPSAVSQGPQLGYLWVAGDHTLRPVLGVPGSSQLGKSVVAADVFTFAASSVRSSVAVLGEADGSVDVMKLPSGTPIRIAGVSATAATRVALSPDGQNAVLFLPGAASVTLLTALGSAPSFQTLHAPAGLLASSVSDTAEVAAVSGGGPYPVALLSGKGGALTSLAAFGGMSFLSGGDDLLIADNSTGAVTLLRHSSSAPSASVFRAAEIKTPVAVAGSNDGHYALVANGTDESIVRLDLASGAQAERIGCACQPVQLAALAGNAVFGLTAAGTGPTWIVDASSAKPSTLFIPAAVK